MDETRRTAPRRVDWRVVGMALLIGIGILGDVPGAEPKRPPALKASRFRRPVALAFDGTGAKLYVANQRSGSLSVIDTATSQVVNERVVGTTLSDLAAVAGTHSLLAVDSAEHALRLLNAEDLSFPKVQRLSVSPDPVRILVASDGKSCVVASRWSRRLSVISLRRDNGDMTALTCDRTIVLPFSPRELAWLGDGSELVAADAFGGKLAVVDLAKGSVVSIRNLPAHNIRGLARSPDGRSLVVAHQVAHRLARTTFEDVHWGSVLSNHLRILRTDALRNAGNDAELLEGSRLIDLGEVGSAAGDPAGVAFDGRGRLAVAFAGVGEVALGIGLEPGYELPSARVGAGRRPTALAFAPDGKTLYVADSAGDAIPVIDGETGRALRTIALGPRPEPSLAERGEQLFYDAHLSHDGWMSCHSCHTDGHTNGGLSDTLGDGSYGAPKRVPSLFGVGATGPWTWRGDLDRLESQVRKSIETTMYGKAADEEVEALTAFLRGLSPPPPTLTAAPESNRGAIERGRALFRARECAGCHAPPNYTMPDRFDVGLVDEVGNKKFNPPSLLGVSLREPLLHDGRAATLESVFREHHHPKNATYSSAEIDDLVAFLKTL